MKVAVYTIAKNEEQFVQKWYESAKDADFLLIADTGSTDQTVAKAKALNINVLSIVVKPWRFDDARNASLSLIPNDIDYCIALDMDEVLLPGWRAELQKAFEQGITRPRYKYTWSWNEDGTPGKQFFNEKIHTRFNYRWKFPIHEIVCFYSSDEKFVEKTGWFGLEIHHYPDQTKPRSQYLPLLRMATLENPHDDRMTFYYARELFFHQRFSEASVEFKRHLALPTALWKAERSECMRYIGKCSKGEEASEWFQKSIKEYPERREPYVDLSVHYYVEQNWVECFKWSSLALEITEPCLDYCTDNMAWGSIPHDMNAIASYNIALKNVDTNEQRNLFMKAFKQGILALSKNKNDKRLRANLDFYKDKAKEFMVLKK